MTGQLGPRQYDLEWKPGEPGVVLGTTGNSMPSARANRGPHMTSTESVKTSAGRLGSSSGASPAHVCTCTDAPARMSQSSASPVDESRAASTAAADRAPHSSISEESQSGASAAFAAAKRALIKTSLTRNGCDPWAAASSYRTSFSSSTSQR